MIWTSIRLPTWRRCLPYRELPCTEHLSVYGHDGGSRVLGRLNVKCNLVLVTLTPDQILRAKETNGKRKRITHALLCGSYGQLFGTEKQCLKYFTAWDPGYRIEVSSGNFQPMFPGLFNKAIRADNYEIADYECTWNLTDKLIEASNALQSDTAKRIRQPGRRIDASNTEAKTGSQGFFRRIFSRLWG